MSNNSQFLLYLFVIAIAIVVSLLKFKQLDKGSKMLALLLILTLTSEIVSYYTAKVYRNNFPVYHFFAPIQLFMVGLYFHYSIEDFKKTKIGIYIGILGFIVAVLNTLIFQPITSLNSYFLLFEGVCTIFMSLYAFNRMFINEDIDLLTLPHFWFTFILLTFWCITYLTWGLYEVAPYKMARISALLSKVIWVVNLITYIGIGFVFLMYRKKLAPRE